MNFFTKPSHAVALALLSLSLSGGWSAAQSTPSNTACIRVQRVEIQDLTPAFGWLQQSVRGLVGQCLSEETLTGVLRQTTNDLAARGFVTSRLYVPEQDAGQGTLKLLFVPGRVNEIRVTGGKLDAGRVLTLRKGDLLTTRAIDQATDQLRRLVSLDAKVLIEPADAPGQSNLNIVLTPTGRPYHGSVSVGQDDLNRDFVNVGDLPPAAQQLAALPLQVAVDFDNPLKKADVLSLNAVLSPGYVLQQGGTFSVGGRYSLPFGKTLFGIGGSYTVNHSLQPGYETTLDYNGKSLNFNTDLSRVVTRDDRRVVNISEKLSAGLSWSYINDLEILVQRKNTYRSVTGVNYAYNTPELQYSFGVSGAISYNDFLNTPDVSGWNAMIQPTLTVTRNFHLGRTAARYTGSVDGQLTVAGEQYQPYVVDNSVVRGLPSGVYLSAPHALGMQNKVMALLNERFSPYMTLDGTWVSATDTTPLTSLFATTIGAQGRLKRLNYDFRVGYPLNIAPELARPTFGLQLSWSF